MNAATETAVEDSAAGESDQDRIDALSTALVAMAECNGCTFKDAVLALVDATLASFVNRPDWAKSRGVEITGDLARLRAGRLDSESLDSGSLMIALRAYSDAVLKAPAYSDILFMPIYSRCATVEQRVNGMWLDLAADDICQTLPSRELRRMFDPACGAGQLLLSIVNAVGAEHAREGVGELMIGGRDSARDLVAIAALQLLMPQVHFECPVGEMRLYVIDGQGKLGEPVFQTRKINRERCAHAS